MKSVFLVNSTKQEQEFEVFAIRDEIMDVSGCWMTIDQDSIFYEQKIAWEKAAS